jgi:alcohol dehydrogenase (cytochrome c)
MLFLPLSEFCMLAGPTGQTEGPYVNLLSTNTPLYPAQKPDSDGKFGRLQAVDLETRELSWSFREVNPPTSAALSTAGGVVFLGSLDQSFKAFDDRNGEVLWQTDLGDVPAAFPITYSVEGKQHIAVIVGQPTLHANLLMGALYEFLGVEQNPLLELSQTGPALVVLALE